MIPTLLCTLLLAQQPTPNTESNGPQHTLVRAARMLDVVTGKLVEHPEIEIDGRNIVAVRTGQGPWATVNKMIDLGDVTLLPGLIDMHTHLTGQLSPDSENAAVHETAADSAFHAVVYAKRTLLAGFTTVRDVGSGEFVDISLMHAIDRGDIDGPWMFPAGNPISITGGHGDVTGFRPGILQQGPEQGV